MYFNHKVSRHKVDQLWHSHDTYKLRDVIERRMSNNSQTNNYSKIEITIGTYEIVSLKYFV